MGNRAGIHPLREGRPHTLGLASRRLPRATRSLLLRCRHRQCVWALDHGGALRGIDSGDHLWMSRYIMIRVCEAQQVNVSFDPKPIPGDWNGAGCHTNYSTEPMRNDGGFAKIIEAIEKLKDKHLEHISVYGVGNERRLTGAHETAPIDKFSYGVANRGASVRIPRSAEADGKGYFEDRRPASNMDPYVVTSKLFRTTCLE